MAAYGTSATLVGTGDTSAFLPKRKYIAMRSLPRRSASSAEEMERYYTIPIEVGLAATPGVDVIRSTSFYGLSFVRVVFQYGVDYYFARPETAINLQQNVSLTNNVTPHEAPPAPPRPKTVFTRLPVGNCHQLKQ